MDTHGNWKLYAVTSEWLQNHTQARAFSHRILQASPFINWFREPRSFTHTHKYLCSEKKKRKERGLMRVCDPTEEASNFVDPLS